MMKRINYFRSIYLVLERIMKRLSSLVVSWIKRIYRPIEPVFRYLFITYPARTALLAILITVTWTNFGLKFWKEPDRIMVWDVKVFYVYLPATIIYKDLSLEFIVDKKPELGEIMFQEKGPKGMFYIQATYGLSLLYSPFFLGAHAYSTLTGSEPNGYSPPYKLALIISCIFYLAIGSYFFMKFLLRYFSQWVTAITMVVIVLGTNLFYYSTYEAPMSHAYNFSLIAVFLYFTPIWYDKINARNTIIMGLLLGLIALVRPVNFIIILFFVLYGVHNRETFRERILLLLRSYGWILLMIAAFFLVWIPQFIYWKFISGSYYFYSYSDQRFYFNNPQVISSLFSYRKGLFVYIPLIAFAFVGIPFLFRKYKGLILPVAVFTAINVYVLSSWCFWWFGGGFGPRSYIDTYAIMAIPFAAITAWILNRRWWAAVPYILMVATLVWFNLFQTKQYFNGAINWMGMTKEAYWDSFLRRYPSSEFWGMLRFPDPALARKGIYYEGDLTIDELYPKKKEINKSNDPAVIHDAEMEKHIRALERYIRSDKKWFKQMQEKAKRDNIPVDTAIRRDAIWLYEKDQKKLKEANTSNNQ